MSTIRVFIDDVRTPKAQDWIVIRSAHEAIRFIDANWNFISEISLDHDLGEHVPSGYDIAKWIEEQIEMCGREPLVLRCHSANPVGARNILMIAQKYTIMK